MKKNKAIDFKAVIDEVAESEGIPLGVASRYFGVSRRTLYNYINDNRLDDLLIAAVQSGLGEDAQPELDSNRDFSTNILLELKLFLGSNRALEIATIVGRYAIQDSANYNSIYLACVREDFQEPVSSTAFELRSDFIFLITKLKEYYIIIDRLMKSFFLKSVVEKLMTFDNENPNYNKLLRSIDTKRAEDMERGASLKYEVRNLLKIEENEDWITFSFHKVVEKFLSINHEKLLVLSVHQNTTKIESSNSILFFEATDKDSLFRFDELLAKKMASNNLPLFRIPTFHDADFGIGVFGYSMDPKYSYGDILICRFVNGKSVSELTYGADYIFIDRNNYPTVSTLRKSSREEEGFIKMQHLHESADDRDVPLQGFTVFAMVIGVVKRVSL